MKRLHCLTLFLALQLSQNIVQGQVALSAFYPYGTSAGDLRLPAADDASTAVPIQFDFPFFDSTYRIVHISTNGQINFGSGQSGYVPRPFPLNGYQSVASYWTDSHPGRGGFVHYRESELPSLLSQLTNDIRSRFVEHQSFTSRWALVVTFENVPAFGCITSGTPTGCATNCANTNTFQTVLTSNGIQSFAIFNFNKLTYTVGTAACTAHAQVGFNAGDGARFFLMNSSNTANIQTTPLTTSNVGVRGKWMFTIDGADIAEGCNDRGLMEIFPRKLLYFGRQNIVIGGPCLQGAPPTLSVTIGTAQMTCLVSASQQLNCITPRLTRLGNNDVTLVFNGVTYRSFVVVVDIDDRMVSDGLVDTEDASGSNTAFTLRWDRNRSCANDTIDFTGFQVDYILDDAANIVSEVTETLNYERNPNNGIAVLQPFNRPAGTSFIRSISLAGYCSANPRSESQVSIARILYIDSSSLSTAHCVTWHSQQPSQAQMDTIVNQVTQVNPCAPGVPADIPQTSGNLVLDGTCNPGNPSLCSFYHPSARACYRSITSVNGRVTQCCYDNKLQLLILGPPSGGSLAFHDPTASLTTHLTQDIIPFVTCCKWNVFDYCFMYYEKRPSIDARLFQPPNNGNGGGDPHFSTLDGTSYTFNPIGEFIYFAAGTDIVQTRIAQYEDNLGTKKQACYFSAFVISSGQSDKVQVELSAVKVFAFRINGQTVNLEFGRWSFGRMSVDYRNNATVVMQTSQGIEVEIRIIGGVLNTAVSIPASLKGQVSGLLGNWDDVADNDFQLPNGTFLPINSSPADIHNKFGMAWSTTSVTSLFTYPTGLAWFNYQNSLFVPSFAVPPNVPACNGDKDCNYDVMVTGDINVGLSNVAMKERIAEADQRNAELATYCPASLWVANGEVIVEETSASMISYSVVCKDGFQLQGREKVMCVNAKYDALSACVPAR